MSFIESGQTRRILLHNIYPRTTRWFDLSPLIGLHRTSSLSISSVTYHTSADDQVTVAVEVTNSGPDQSGTVDVIRMRTVI